MAFTQTKKISLGALLIAAALAATFFIVRFSHKRPDSVRAELLGFVPGDATSVIFIDLDQLRASSFLQTLYSWAPHPAADPEYKHFVGDPGFDYERDVSQVFIAISNRGATSSTLVLAEGKFNRKKIEPYLSKNSPPAKQGNLTIFQIRAAAGARPGAFAFLSD